MDHVLLGHLFLFLTTIAGFIFQWFREGRRHVWEREQFRTLGTEIKKNGQRTETETPS